jgi:hypothetical protein
MEVVMQPAYDASILYFKGYTLHTAVYNGREVCYRLTHPCGKQETTRGLLTRNLRTLAPCVWVPASLQERFGHVAVVDATIVAWVFAEGVQA